MLRTLDQHPPIEQAGFRSGYSTIDHIQVISQLQEKADEYKTPLCFAFVDYEKAFDSIELKPLFESLENQGVEAAYITLLRLYNGVISTRKRHSDSDKSSCRGEWDKATTSHPNTLLHVCRTPLSINATGSTKESTSTVNICHTWSLPMI